MKQSIELISNTNNILQRELKLRLIHERTDYFNYCFPRGNNNLKEIFNTWDRFINNSLNNGHSHFSITINLNNMLMFGKCYPNDNGEKTYWKDVYKNILKMHPIEVPIYNLQQDLYNSTKYSKFCNLQDNLFNYCCDDNLYDYVNTIMSYTNATTWFFLTTEENKQGVLHLHGIFAVKNIMDYNKPIAINLLNELKHKYTNCDIVIKSLDTFKQVKGWIKYLHINKTWVFKPRFFVTNPDFMNNGREEEIFKYFLQPYMNNYKLHNTILEESKYTNYKLDSLNQFTGWGEDDMLNFYEDRYLKVAGCILNKNQMSKRLILDMISYYLLLNNLYVYNNNIYIKIENSIISYKLLGSIEEILYNGFQNVIIPFFLEKYPCHFIGFDFCSLLLEFKQDSKKSIMDIISLVTNKIQFDFTIMEFEDGIYDIKKDHFYPKEKLINQNLFYKKATIKYYNKYYSWARRNSPKVWITLLANAIQNNRQDFECVCIFLAQLFQNNKDIENKKRYLYVFGESNTGKTTILSKLVERYFGNENIGSVTGGVSQFKYQNIENKSVVVIDEFRYCPNDSAELLKLLAGESLLVNKKYAKEHITIANFMGLILSNLPLIDQNIDIQNALLNRLYTIEFKKNNNIIKKNDFNKCLAEEEAEIIIFCNKLYFHAVSKRKLLKKIPYVTLITCSKSTFTIIKATYISTHKYKLLKFQNSWNMDRKFYHYNSRFDITDNDSIFMSLTTTPVKPFGKFLWSLDNGKNQYISYNHVCIIKNNLKNQILEIDNNFINDSLKLHKKLIESNNLTQVEHYLTSAYSQFERCMQHTQNIRKCNTLLVEYSNQTEIIMYMCQNIFMDLF